MLHITETKTRAGTPARRFAKHTREIRIVMTKFAASGDLVSFPSFRAAEYEAEIDMAQTAREIAASQGRGYFALIEGDTVIDVACKLSHADVADLRRHGAKKFTARAMMQAAL